MGRVILLLAMLIALPASAQVTGPGAMPYGAEGAAEGAGFDTAIPLDATGSASVAAASGAERGWIAANRPSALMLGRRQVTRNGQVVDIVTLNVRGRRQEVYFDVSGFYGR